MTKSDTCRSPHQVSFKEKRIIAVMGDECSGKTCLVKHLLQKDATKSLQYHNTTIDESHYTMKKMPDGTHEQIQIIDTAPWMEFPVMHQLYIKNSHLVIVAYDVTSKSWKESLTDKINQIRNFKVDADILIVGTHADKTNMLMNCVPAHVQQVIGRLPHVYTSAVTGFGVSLLWHKILNKVSTSFNPTSIRSGVAHRHRSNTTPNFRRSGSVRKMLKKTSTLLLCTSKYQTL